MNYKILSTLTAILSFLNGVFFLLFPAFSLSLLGRSTDPAGSLGLRFFGACAFGLAVITWMARSTPHPEVRRLVSWGMLGTLGLLALLDLLGIFTGAISPLGWLFFAADFGLALAFLLSIFTAGGRD